MWCEADINYITGYRGNDRLLYSNEGIKQQIYYKTFLS
nr:hypothetical protein [Bacillus halotolerans]